MKMLSIATSFGGAFFRRAPTRRQRLSCGLSTARVTVSNPHLQNNNKTRSYNKKKTLFLSKKNVEKRFNDVRGYDDEMTVHKSGISV